MYVKIYTAFIPYCKFTIRTSRHGYIVGARQLSVHEFNQHWTKVRTNFVKTNAKRDPDDTLCSSLPSNSLGLPVQQGQQSQPIVTDPQPPPWQHPKAVVLFRFGFLLNHQCVFLGLLERLVI